MIHERQGNYNPERDPVLEARLWDEVEKAVESRPILDGLTSIRLEENGERVRIGKLLLLRATRDINRPARIQVKGEPSSGKTTFLDAFEDAAIQVGKAIGQRVVVSRFRYDRLTYRDGVGVRQNPDPQALKEANERWTHEIENDPNLELAGRALVLQTEEFVGYGAPDPNDRDCGVTTTTNIAKNFAIRQSQGDNTGPELFDISLPTDLITQEIGGMLRAIVTEEKRGIFVINNEDVPRTLAALGFYPGEPRPNETMEGFGKRLRDTFLRMARQEDIKRIRQEIDSQVSVFRDSLSSSELRKRKDLFTPEEIGKEILTDLYLRYYGSLKENQIEKMLESRIEKYKEIAIFMEHQTRNILGLDADHGIIAANPFSPQILSVRKNIISN